MDPKDWNLSTVNVKQLAPNFDGNTILHHYATNSKALENIFYAINKEDEGEEDGSDKGIS